jgi:uncharacterized protein YggE
MAAACDEKTTYVTPGNDSAGLTVSGRGEVLAPADTGFITIGVEVRATTVADAQRDAAQAADAVIKSVRANGVDEKDIKTTGLSISPQYETRSTPEPRITGYIVTNSIDVRIRKLDAMSKVVDEAVAAGGNAARLRNIRFTIDDNAKVIEQARELAMADAKAKAEQLAKAGGVKLGKPLSISESQSTSPQPVERAAGALQPAPDVSTPIEPGQNSVVVYVNVRWSIED